MVRFLLILIFAVLIGTLGSAILGRILPEQVTDGRFEHCQQSSIRFGVVDCNGVVRRLDREQIKRLRMLSKGARLRREYECWVTTAKSAILNISRESAVCFDVTGFTPTDS